MKRAFEYIATAVVAIILALIVRNFVLTAYRVPTISMAPTLKPGDFIFANRLAYSKFGSKTGPPELPLRGDVVVFRFPTEPKTVFVKRVIGLPGDEIRFDSGRIVLNGQHLSYEERGEQSISDLPGAQYLDVMVEQGQGLNHLVMYDKAQNPGTEKIVKVPPGKVYLLGDNRDASDDSRERGPVPIENIEGQVLFIWLSLDYRERWLQNRIPGLRWERTFSVVD